MKPYCKVLTKKKKKNSKKSSLIFFKAKIAISWGTYNGSEWGKFEELKAKKLQNFIKEVSC